jgi:hypothetical protein
VTVEQSVHTNTLLVVWWHCLVTGVGTGGMVKIAGVGNFLAGDVWWVETRPLAPVQIKFSFSSSVFQNREKRERINFFFHVNFHYSKWKTKPSRQKSRNRWRRHENPVFFVFVLKDRIRSCCGSTLNISTIFLFCYLNALSIVLFLPSNLNRCTHTPWTPMPSVSYFRHFLFFQFQKKWKPQGVHQTLACVCLFSCIFFFFFFFFFSWLVKLYISLVKKNDSVIYLFICHVHRTQKWK